MRWSLDDVQRLQEAFDTFANEVRSVVTNVEKRTAYALTSIPLLTLTFPYREQMSDDLKRAVVLRKGLGDLTVARGRPLKAVDVGERKNFFSPLLVHTVTFFTGSSSTKKARRTDEESMQRYTVTDEQPLAFTRMPSQPHAIVNTMVSALLPIPSLPRNLCSKAPPTLSSTASMRRTSMSPDFVHCAFSMLSWSHFLSSHTAK